MSHKIRICTRAAAGTTNLERSPCGCKSSIPFKNKSHRSGCELSNSNLPVRQQPAWERLQRPRAIGYRLSWKMSAKLTLVVHSRRTDEADGDSDIGARAYRLRREGARSACKGAG